MEEVFIGIVCVSPAFMNFFKPRKLKYTREKIIHKKDGTTYSLNRTLQYDVKIDSKDLLINVQKIGLRKLIVTEIINSLKSITPKGYEFDIDAFNADLNRFLQKN